MDPVDQARRKVLSKLDGVLKTLSAKVPKGTPIVCLLMAADLSSGQFAACEQSMWDGDPDEPLEFHGSWSLCDKGLDKVIYAYRELLDGIDDLEERFASRDDWERACMALLREHEKHSPYVLRLVYFTEPRSETMERYKVRRSGRRKRPRT